MEKAGRAYIVTGPTSGIGRATAMKLSKFGTVILLGRNQEKLNTVQSTIREQGGEAVCVVCDLANPVTISRAAAQIKALNLPIKGILNNAGIRQSQPTKNIMGCDMSFATNHLGPFALTEALLPILEDGTHLLFVVSAVEDPKREPAATAGFRGGRYISAEECAQGHWLPGGSVRPGFDAYATSKQALLAAALAFARETPRLRFNAIEPGVNPTTALGDNDGTIPQLTKKILVPLLMPLLTPFIKILRTSEQAGRTIAKVMTDVSDCSGVYFDESGNPMRGSDLVRDIQFQDRVMAETRALLASYSGHVTKI